MPNIPPFVPKACAIITDEIRGLQAEIQGLQADLHDKPPDKAAIGRQIVVLKRSESKAVVKLRGCIDKNTPTPVIDQFQQSQVDSSLTTISIAVRGSGFTPGAQIRLTLIRHTMSAPFEISQTAINAVKATFDGKISFKQREIPRTSSLLQTGVLVAVDQATFRSATAMIIVS